jgi:hypothetical protein
MGEYNMSIAVNIKRSNISLYNQCIKQVNYFNYLDCDVPFIKVNDINKNLLKFQHICGTLGRTLGKKTRKVTQWRLMQTNSLWKCNMDTE